MTDNSSEDRLGTLPKNPIEIILRSLPLQEAIRTNVLSNSWRYEWTNLTQLRFTKDDFPLFKNRAMFDKKISEVVDQALLLHQGPIHKFELDADIFSCKHIDAWISFLSRNDVKELILVNSNCYQLFLLHSCLFSCKKIIYLHLYGCNLTPPAIFSGLGNLTTLELLNVNITESRLEKLISSCPNLNKLKLCLLQNCGTCLKLSAPNLIDLTVNAVEFKDVCFDKTPILAKASLCWTYGVYGSMNKLISILGCVSTIRRLELRGYYSQDLLESDIPLRLPTVCELLHLCVTINFGAVRDMLATFCIFRSSPFLQTLDIMSNPVLPEDSGEILALYDLAKAHGNSADLFSQLQIVKVNRFKGTATELRFIEFVLANARVLEMVHITLSSKDMAGLVMISKKTNRFRRISSKAELVIS